MNEEWPNWAPGEWMSVAWRKCDEVLVVTKGDGWGELPLAARRQAPSPKAIEAVAGYLILAVMGRRSGLIGDGEFDLMMEQAQMTLWQLSKEREAA